MTAFHPALTGVLYSDLAQYEQLLFEMRLAVHLAQADVDEETAERYVGIVDGLKRMIALAEPTNFGSSTIDATEAKRRTYVLLGQLQEQLSEFDIWIWNVQSDGIDANLRSDRPGNESARAAMRAVADQIGIDYIEKRHGRTGNTLMICAKGKINGVSVRIYDLIDAERPLCDTHHVMVDAAGVCRECPVADADSPRLVELREVHAPELHIDVQVCTFCSVRGETPVRWPCQDLRYAEIELGGAKYRNDVRLRHFGQKRPGVGRVCVGCSEERGVTIMWPCLLLRAVDRLEGVAHADSGLLETPAPTANLKHALMPDGAEQPRCGASQGSRFAMLAENVTCPECRHLLEEQLAGYGTNDPDDETESTSTESPGDAS